MAQGKSRFFNPPHPPFHPRAARAAEHRQQKPSGRPPAPGAQAGGRWSGPGRIVAGPLRGVLTGWPEGSGTARVDFFLSLSLLSQGLAQETDRFGAQGRVELESAHGASRRLAQGRSGVGSEQQFLQGRHHRFSPGDPAAGEERR